MEKFSLDRIRQVCDSVENEMRKLEYEHESVARYSMLMEEALLKWKEDLSGDAEVDFQSKRAGGHVELILSVPGKKVYPFETEAATGGVIGLLHDRLLSGTGSEFRYGYRKGRNVLKLWLPCDNHEKRLFYKNLWALAIPVAIQSLLTTTITATDSILMGFLDQDSLSAISITGSFIAIYNILITSLVAGTTIFASQCWGKHDWKGINRVCAISLRFSLTASLLFFIATCFFSEQVMSIYTNIPELIEKGGYYFRMISPMFLFSAFYQVYYAIMKNTGRAKRCTIFMVGAAILDCALNVVLIFGLLGFDRMGIRGAALGTVIASGIQFAVTLSDFIINPNMRFDLFRRLENSGRILMDYLKKSSPLALQMITWTIADNIIVSMFGHMGSDIVAAHGVVGIASEMGIFACAGLYQTCGIMIGSKLGNGNLKMAKEYSARYLRLMILVGACTTAAFLIMDLFIQKLPLSLSDEAFRYLRIMLIVVAFELAFKGLNCVMNYGGFYAGGDTVALMIIDTINMWLIIVPVGLLCLYVFKLPPIVVALLLHADEFTSFPFKFWRYKSYKWLRNLTE